MRGRFASVIGHENETRVSLYWLLLTLVRFLNQRTRIYGCYMLGHWIVKSHLDNSGNSGNSRESSNPLFITCEDLFASDEHVFAFSMFITRQSAGD